MKRILTLSVLFLCCTAISFAQFMGTVSDSQGVKYTANNDEATCYVSGHENTYSTTIIIPYVYKGRKVTSIKGNAFSGCSGLTSVTIPSSVTSIGGSDFSGCSGLTSIVVDENNAVYDSRENCNAIIRTSDNKLIAGCKNTIIPSSVTSIGDHAFYGCSGLTSVTIPSKVTSIGYMPFSGCSGLASIVVDENNSVFDSRDNCNAIIRTSDNKLIAGCKNTIIPPSVTSIDNNAFRGSGLTSVTIPSSVTSIGHFSFGDCSGLTSATIPPSVTSIGDFAFQCCSGLTSVTIPANVTSIGGGAFMYCSGLTSIVVDENNSYFDSRDNCNAIIRTSDNTLIAGCNTTIIPSSVTSIGGHAFSGCSGLTSVTIPSSVTSISSDAFSSCSGLVSIVVDESNSVYDSRDNCNAIIRKSDNTLIAGCKNTIIPSSVTSIGGQAFYGCSGLTTVTIPASVTSINWSAFSLCSGLTTVTIPASVTSIGREVFYKCSGLTSVIVGWDTPFTLNNSVLSGIDLSNVTLFVPKGTKEAYEAADVWKDFGTIIEYEKDNVLNEEDTTVPPSAIDVNVKVMRTINANEWSTICLPFAMTAEQVTTAFGDDVKIGDFDGYDTTEGDGDVVLAISMKFKQVTAMEANHPYVIKVSSKITEFAVDGVDLVPVENPVWVKTSGEMVGTYVAETVIPSGSMFLSGNKFWYSVGNSKMKAFRAYFHLNDVLPDLNGLEPAARVYLAFEDETTEIDATLINSKEKAGNNGWHTLDGRKLAKMPTKKGVYVANGRKVVIK